MNLLKTLQKDSDILDFTKKYERYLQDLAAKHNIATDNLEGAEYLRQERLKERGNEMLRDAMAAERQARRDEIAEERAAQEVVRGRIAQRVEGLSERE